MRLAMMNWRQVEDYLREKQTVIIPTGATEQHGPNGLIGTDHFIADALALAVGERTRTLVHPVLSVGMSLHHLDFPGSSSLRASTFGRVLNDVMESMYRHGCRRFFCLNGHGGNSDAAGAAASDFLLGHPDARFHWESWWKHPRVTALENELFGDRNGSHASAAEISITMHLFPGAVDKIGVLPIEKPDFTWPMSPVAFRATFPDGRMGSDPSLASAEAGKCLFDLSVEIFSEMLEL